jgi:hypothetical protein
MAVRELTKGSTMIDRRTLFTKYMTKVNQIADDLEDKTHFTPNEIINMLVDIIELDYLVTPKQSSPSLLLNDCPLNNQEQN